MRNWQVRVEHKWEQWDTNLTGQFLTLGNVTGIFLLLCGASDNSQLWQAWDSILDHITLRFNIEQCIGISLFLTKKENSFETKFLLRKQLHGNWWNGKWTAFI